MKTYYVGSIPVSDELYHDGRKGMKWGKHIFGDAVGVVSNTARSVGSNVGKAATSAAKTVKSLVSNGSKAVSSVLNNERIGAKLRSNIGEAKSQGLKNVGPDMSNRMENRYRQDWPADYKTYGEEKIKNYQNYQKALNDYRDYSNNPVNTVARILNTPQNKGNWAFAVPGNEKYLEKFDQKWIPKTDNIKEWFTGSNYKEAADERERYAQDYERLRDENEYMRAKGMGPHLDELTEWAREDREYKDALTNLYNNAPRQKIAKAAKDVREWGSKAAKDVSSWGGKQVDKGKKFFKKIFG